MSKRAKIWDVIYPTVYILLCMILCTAAVLIVVGAVTKQYDVDKMRSEIKVLPLIISAAAYVLVIFAQRKNRKRDNLRFGPDENRWGRGTAILACIGIVCAGHLWSTIITKSGLEDVFAGYRSVAAGAFEGQNMIVLIAVTCILGPIAEEIVFRALTYRRARAYCGIRWAVLISAFLFGLYHGNVIQFLYAFGIGILLALIYEKSGSLMVCIAAHMCVNLWAVFCDRIADALFGGALTGVVIWLVIDAVAATLIFRKVFQKK